MSDTKDRDFFIESNDLFMVPPLFSIELRKPLLWASTFVCGMIIIGFQFKNPHRF